MKKISTYIFVHDQQIILDTDINGKFNSLPDMKYVFLGKGQTDKIDGRADIIIARNLENNIEQHPKFCAFTGWYALWKNNLMQSEYVHLLEYDITVSDNFNTETESLIEQKYDFIGYIPLSMHHCYISHPEYLGNILPSIQNHYGIDMKEWIIALRKRNKLAEWSSTSNSTFSFETFNQYMNWFEKLINDLKDSPMSGHAQERSISFFYLIFNKKVILTQKLIKHFMMNSSQYA